MNLLKEGTQDICNKNNMTLLSKLNVIIKNDLTPPLSVQEIISIVYKIFLCSLLGELKNNTNNKSNLNNNSIMKLS